MLLILCFAVGFVAGFFSQHFYRRFSSKKIIRFQKTIQANRFTPDKVVNGILNAELQKRIIENPTLSYLGFRIVTLGQNKRTYEFLFQKK